VFDIHSRKGAVCDCTCVRIGAAHRSAHLDGEQMRNRGQRPETEGSEECEMRGNLSRPVLMRLPNERHKTERCVQ